MNGDACLPDKSQIARELLMYLAKHPDAQDTRDGILQKWLPNHGKRYKPLIVQEVLKDLVLEGTIIETTVPGLQSLYRFNVAKRDRMKEIFKKAGGKD